MWNADEITDFVRKLGFLEPKKVKGKDIKQFQKLYEVNFVLCVTFLILIICYVLYIRLHCGFQIFIFV